MAQCDAWRLLSGAAVKVWVELRSRYNGKNNGSLSLSWDEASRLLGLGKATVGRAFAELERKGFIVMTRRGRWYGRLATTWAVTDRSHLGEFPTHAYRSWRRPPRRQKQNLGLLADHEDALTGPPQYRPNGNGSVAAVVTADSRTAMGADSDHLYNHGDMETSHEG
jgi:hypothetical protein